MGNGPIKILVIDDEELICWSLKRFFEKEEGHSVCCAYTGADAFQKVMENRYDVIITDMKHPDMDGADFVKSLKKMNGPAPIIVMSSFFSENMMDDIAFQDVFKCISKPFRIEDVLRGVKEAAGLKTFPSTL